MQQTYGHLQVYPQACLIDSSLLKDESVSTLERRLWIAEGYHGIASTLSPTPKLSYTKLLYAAHANSSSMCVGKFSQETWESCESERCSGGGVHGGGGELPFTIPKLPGQCPVSSY